MVKWETMWEGPDSQDVGLEAAIILAVWAFPHRFPLNHDFGTLAGGLGCFPLHDGR